MKNLAAALVKAQREVKNPSFDATNPHFKSKYASLVAVCEEVIPVFNKHGLAVEQWPVCRAEGERLFAGCKTVLMHESGEFQESECLLPLEKMNAHGAGSAITYSRRYSLMALAGVVGDEDDDANAAVKEPSMAQKIVAANVTPLAGVKERLAAPQVEKIDRVASSMLDMFQAGYDIEKICACGQETAMDADEKAYLWSLFDSKQRSAMTKYAQSKRKKATPEELATQA